MDEKQNNRTTPPLADVHTKTAKATRGPVTYMSICLLVLACITYVSSSLFRTTSSQSISIFATRTETASTMRISPILDQPEIRAMLKEYMRMVNGIADEVLRESGSDNTKMNPRNIMKRGIIDQLISSLGDKAVTAVESGMASAMTQVLNEMMTAATTGDTQSVAGKLLGTVANATADPAGALGSGLGMGAVMGLELPQKMLKAVTGPPKPVYTGINLVAQNLGSNLTSSVLGLVNVSAIANAVTVDPATIQGASKALAQGLGGGARMSLVSTLPAGTVKIMNGSDFNNSGVAGIAGNFGQGLTVSFLSGLDLKALAAMATPAMPIDINPIALAAAQGLGSGAITGLVKGIDMPGLLTASAGTSAFNESGTPGIAGNFGQGITQSFLEGVNIKMLASMAMDSLPAMMPADTNNIALAAAQGLGSGAITGIVKSLDMTNLLSANALQPAFNTTGTPGIAGNFGNGITTSFIQSVNLKAVAAMAMEAAPSTMGLDVNALALAGAQGIGSGAISGIGKAIGIPGLVNLDAVSTAFNSSGTNGIAGNFGQGLSQSFIESVNVSTVANMAMAIMPAMNIDANGAALALAQGIGTGVLNGILPPGNSLQVSNAVTTFNTTGANGIAGNLGQGVTQSLIGGINITAAAGLVKQLASQQTGGTMMMLGPAAAGFGAGLGEGAAVGLGLQPSMPIATGDQSTAAIAKNFALGLTSNFLQNGTLTKLATLVMGNETMSDMMAKAGASSALAMANIAPFQVAQGFAMGFLDGAGSSVMDAGGFGALLGPQPMQVATPSFLSLPNSTFNDSIGGGAEGFGRGIGGEGVRVVLQLMGKPNAANLGGSSGTSMAMISGTKMGGMKKRSSDLVIRDGVARRQFPDFGSLNVTGFNLTELTNNINITMIDFVAQKFFDTLTPLGVKGFLNIGVGIIEGGQIPFINNFLKSQLNSGLPNITKILEKIPDSLKKEPIIFSTGMNDFKIDLAATEITGLAYVNGNGIVKHALVLGLHIVLAIVAYTQIIPLMIILAQAQDMAVLLKYKTKFAKTDSQQKLLGVAVLGSAFIIVITGVVAAGTHPMFSSTHEILGLLLLFITIIQAPLALMRKSSSSLKLIQRAFLALLIFLSIFTIFSGFTDLFTLPIPIDTAGVGMSIGFGLTNTMFVAVGAWTLKNIIAGWVRKGSRVVEEDRERLIGGEKGASMTISRPAPAPSTRFDNDI